MYVNKFTIAYKILYIFGSKTGLKLFRLGKTKTGSKTEKDCSLQSFVVQSGLLQS